MSSAPRSPAGAPVRPLPAGVLKTDYLKFSQLSVADELAIGESLDDARLETDRAKLKPEQLEEAGLTIEQDENFFIRPKSDALEQSVREAA